MTCKPSLEISCYNSLSPPSPQLVRDWRFASQTWQLQTSNFISQPRYLQNQLITTKIAEKDSDVSYERNRSNTIERCFQYVTWLVNLGQYLRLPVCAISSIPSFTGIHQRQVYIDESGFNIFTRRTKGRSSTRTVLPTFQPRRASP